MDQSLRENPLLALLRNRERGRQMGVWSCCSANEYVIRAAMRRAKGAEIPVLVEATANQVNQDGGYTGMTPVEFRAFLSRIAAEEGLPAERVLCGGDHLGPLTWRGLPAAEAMARAETLVESYVLAGFSKIHLDTSMRLGDDDPEARLSDEVIAQRGARLCAAAERAWARLSETRPGIPAPVYVIGSEVPIPGGAQENEDSVAVTDPGACRATLTAFRSAFERRGLESAWGRVVGLVVQPGVEFADESVVTYRRAAAEGLTACLRDWPELVFEGHSTDYQPREALREMVEDGIAILKVGPALTFALREGLFALEEIERELSGLYGLAPSGFRSALENAMTEDDRYWAGYYRGSPERCRYARSFSYSDRARYYLPCPGVAAAISRLMENLDRRPIPPALLSQYLPAQYERVRTGALPDRAEDILIDRVGDRIDDYIYAVLR